MLLLQIGCTDGSTGYLLGTDYTGDIGEVSYNTLTQGFLPIVCLKSDTKLEKLDDDSFRIVKSPTPASEISKVPTDYYGAEVTNYTAPHAGVDKWRIYYADETNVYLIADDYIAGENAPDGQSGSTIYQNSTYELSFNNVYEDYTGARWINENSKGSKLLRQFLREEGTSTNTNIKAVAYIMDTNVWSEYYASEDAEYAMGGPTLEMFCASYKDTHPSKYLECGNLNSNGYEVRWNGGSWDVSESGLMQDDFNSIYIKSNTSKVEQRHVARFSFSYRKR